jgi:hypothetical protein
MFSNKIQNICNKLLEECDKSNMNFRHASGIMCGGKLLATGFNTSNRSRISKASVPSIHSEIMAIYNYLKLSSKQLCREKYCCVL